MLLKGGSTLGSAIPQGNKMAIRMLGKAGIELAVCLITPFAGAACAGPQALEDKVHAHADVSSYSELGFWFGDHGQYSCAVETYKAALKLDPRSPDLLYLLGLSLYSSHHAQEAVAPLQQSVHLKPEVLKPHLILAFALSQLKRSEEAKAQWEAALQIDPHSTTALDGLAKLLIADGNYRFAIELLRPAPPDENLMLDLAEAYDNAGLLNDAADMLTAAVRANPSSLPLSSALVTVLVRQTHFEDAAKLAEKSINLHPHDIGAQILYLHMLVLNDDVTPAQPLARKLLAVAPHDFGVLYLNGVLERESGQYAAARGHLQAAVALNPNHYNSRYNLGVVLAQLKDPLGARKQLEKALALGASEPQVRYELASVLRTLGETQLAQEQLKLYQQEAQARSNRTLAAGKAAQGDNELAGGDPQKAVEFYSEAVKAYSQDAMLNYKLALALDRTGDSAAERFALDQAVKIDPNLAVAHNQLGYLASRNGDPASAEEHFRLAVRAAPDYTQAWVSLAATLGMESRFPEAQAAITSALRLDPQNSEALQLRKDLTAAEAQR
jgi:tetratricopeptide (TPR) repeat protein